MEREKIIEIFFAKKAWSKANLLAYFYFLIISQNKKREKYFLSRFYSNFYCYFRSSLGRFFHSAIISQRGKSEGIKSRRGKVIINIITAPILEVVISKSRGSSMDIRVRPCERSKPFFLHFKKANVPLRIRHCNKQR